MRRALGEDARGTGTEAISDRPETCRSGLPRRDMGGGVLRRTNLIGTAGGARPA